MRPSSAQQNASHMSEKNVSFHVQQRQQYKNSITTNNQYRHKESEKLLEEIMQLKQSINQLKDENIKLRTRNTNLEKDLLKCTKIIEEVEATGNMKRFYAKPSTDNQMILSLKNQVKELRSLIDQREHEILSIKKSAKYTKLTEIEIERKLFQDETIRMKQYMDELVQQNLYAQQKENDQQRLQDMIQQRDALIKQIQHDNEQYEQENKNMQVQLSQLVEAYQELDKQYSKLDQQTQQKLKNKDKQIQELRTQIQRLKEQYDREKATIKKISPPLKQYNKAVSNVTKRVQSAKPTINDRKISLDEITSIVEVLKYKLIALQIKSIDHLLFKGASENTTINELCEALQQNPLSLEKLDALKFARFLIESPDQQYPSSLTLSQNNSLIRGLFFKTIGFWPCYDQVEQRVIELGLAKLFDGLYQQIQQQMNKGVYTKQQFKNILEKILGNRKLRELELSYIISKIILKSQYLNELKGEQFIIFIKELQKIELDGDITADDLQQYYEKIGNERGYFYYKQLRTKQEQIIALLEEKEGKQEEKEEEQNFEGSPQKSVQDYIIKSGLVRSHSDPDPLQLQFIIQSQEEQEQEQEQEQEEQNKQKLLNEEQQYEVDQDQFEEEYNNKEKSENHSQQQQYVSSSQQQQEDLDNAHMEEDDEDDYNINAEGVFEEDNDDENDQWEKVEAKATFPIRQDRQIPNSRPTSSYMNRVNRSNSDVKASLASELHPQINEEAYMEEQFEDD